MHIDIDFGTTNSAVAVLGADGRAAPVPLVPGERAQRTVIHASEGGVITFGNAAFQAYLEQDLSGRFLRSLKAFLSQDVPSTRIAGRMASFTELVTAYLRFLLARAEQVLEAPITHAVIGRPVRFHADPERDALAADRLRAAVVATGIPSFSFALEPVAAAVRYELGLDRERIVLVGDFGGGTSDFAVFRAGPGRFTRSDRRDDVLGTSGVAAAGDALDARFLNAFLAESFGRGARWRRSPEAPLERWDHPIHRQIEQLYAIHLLRSRALAEGLDRIEVRMEDARPVRRLRRLVFDDLGYPLAWAIEATKRAFSEHPTARFLFDDIGRGLALDLAVDRDAYARAADDLLTRFDAAIGEVLRSAQIASDDVDDVFLTGGTSQLPFVQDLFVRRFGAERLRSADAFTSVSEGLAALAARS